MWLDKNQSHRVSQCDFSSLATCLHRATLSYVVWRTLISETSPLNTKNHMPSKDTSLKIWLFITRALSTLFCLMNWSCCTDNVLFTSMPCCMFQTGKFAMFFVLANIWQFISFYGFDWEEFINQPKNKLCKMTKIFHKKFLKSLETLEIITYQNQNMNSFDFYWFLVTLPVVQCM